MERMKRLLISSTVIMISIYLAVARYAGKVPDIPEVIICEQRYVGDKYWGAVEARMGDYIYLDGYRSIDTICTPYKEMVDEETPLCGTQVTFEGPLDTSNMNCYASEDDFKGKLKAFKEQREDEKKEDERYYTCDIDSSHIIELYNGCETTLCATNTLRRYFSENCPRANVK